MQRGPITVSYNKVLVNSHHLRGTKPEDNEWVAAQKIGYLRYINAKKTKEGQLQFKTPRITMDHGGIPPYHKEFYPDDKKRSKSFKIPLYNKTDEERALYDKIVEMDEYFDSPEFKKNVMKWTDKSMKKYKYMPILRKAPELEEEDEDDDEETIAKKKLAREKVLKYGPPPDTIKPQFALEHGTDKNLEEIVVNCSSSLT